MYGESKKISESDRMKKVPKVKGTLAYKIVVRRSASSDPFNLRSSASYLFLSSVFLFPFSGFLSCEQNTHSDLSLSFINRRG